MSDPLPPNSNDPQYQQQYAQQPYPPQYAQPSETLSYMTPSNVPLKPTSVMVIGVIGIVIGAYNAICTPVALIVLFLPATAGNAQLSVIQTNVTIKAWIILSTVVGELLAILLLASSIGSVMLKRWARGGMILYAMAAIVVIVVSTIVTLAIVLPATLAEARKVTGANAAAEMGGAIGGLVGTGVGLMFGLVLPICILIFFRKPNVVAAFERGATLPPSMPM